MVCETIKKWIISISRWFRYIGLPCVVLFLSGCTYSVILNNTEGAASDLVDENQTPSPNISIPINVPKGS